jgi:thioredoxin-related protein
MKVVLQALLLVSFWNAAAQHNPADSLPQHLKGLPLPDFKIERPDGSAFYTENLPNDKAVIIILFSPECEHCQQLTKELTEQAHRYKKTHFVMATTLPADKMAAFYKQYRIDQFRNITMGRDVLFFFSRYYQSHYLPMVAVYNRNRELKRVYDGTITPAQLFEHAH